VRAGSFCNDAVLLVQAMGDDREQATDKSKTTASGSALSKIRRRWKWWAAGTLVLLALIWLYWWYFMRGRVSTEDAYVKADSASISSRVDGTVVLVRVNNDTQVAQGDVLVELDPRDYQATVDAAAAVVARIEADIRAAESTLGQLQQDTAAEVEKARAALAQQKSEHQARTETLQEAVRKRLAAEADLANAKKEYDRYEALFRRGSVSQRTRDDALTRYKDARSALEALAAEIQSLQASVDAARQQIGQAEAALKIALSDQAKVEAERFQVESLNAQQKEAAAKLEQARLDLAYTTIKAPIEGFVAQKNIQLGDRVKTGQPFMAVVPIQAAYAEANFKETDLTDVRVGDPAAVEADAYPGHTFRGRVTGIRAGTGAAFALLPPQNASGNWIKVVQRVPVRIDFLRPLPSARPLRVGLSLKVTVYTNRSGAAAMKEAPESGAPGGPAGGK